MPDVQRLRRRGRRAHVPPRGSRRLRQLHVHERQAGQQRVLRRPARAPSRNDARTSAHKVNAGVQLRTKLGFDGSIDFHYVSPQDWAEQVESTFRNSASSTSRSTSTRTRCSTPASAYRFFKNQAELSGVAFNLLDTEHREHPFGQYIDRRSWASSPTSSEGIRDHETSTRRPARALRDRRRLRLRAGRSPARASSPPPASSGAASSIRVRTRARATGTSSAPRSCSCSTAGTRRRPTGWRHSR